MLSAGIEASMVPMFTPAAIMGNLIAPFELGVDTKAMDLPVSGTVTASVVAEAGTSTPSTITDTKVTVTIKKVVVTIKPTVETLKFSRTGNVSRYAQMAQQACIKKYEQDALALASGFSQSVDAGTGVTVAKLIEAGYLIKSGAIPSPAVDAVLSYGAALDIANDIRTQSGAFYGNPNFDPKGAAGLGSGVPGYLGSFFGLNLWETGNHSTSSGNDDMLVVNRQWGLAGVYPIGRTPQFEVGVSEHQEFTSGNVIIRVYMWYGLSEYVDGAGIWLKADT